MDNYVVRRRRNKLRVCIHFVWATKNRLPLVTDVGVRLPSQEDADEEPWTAPPSRQRKEPPISGELPETLELVLGDQIYVAKEGLHPALRNRLLRLAAFQNPEFYKAQAMRLSTYGKPRVIACAEDHPRHLGLPRGCLDERYWRRPWRQPRLGSDLCYSARTLALLPMSSRLPPVMLAVAYAV